MSQCKGFNPDDCSCDPSRLCECIEEDCWCKTCCHDNVITIPPSQNRIKTHNEPGVCCVVGCTERVNGYPLWITLRAKEHCMCFCESHRSDEYQKQREYELGL